MVELSEVIFDIEKQLEAKQIELAGILERQRQASIRTSTARRFSPGLLDPEADRLRPLIETSIQALQLQLNQALIRLPRDIETIDIEEISKPVNLGILALIVVGAILVLR